MESTIPSLNLRQIFFIFSSADSFLTFDFVWFNLVAQIKYSLPFLSGEENDIIIVSLVRSNKDDKVGFVKTQNRICVTLSRAKLGMYVIGNLEMLVKNSGGLC